MRAAPADSTVGRARLRHACAGAIVAMLLLAGCGASRPTLDVQPVERAVAASILAEHHIHAVVGCPAKVPRRAGVAFTCAARLTVGRYPITVRETDDSGHVRYANSAPLVLLNMTRVESAIEHSILAQRGVHASVSCPAQVLQHTGTKFLCSATVDGAATPFEVTELDAAGHVRYLGR